MRVAGIEGVHLVEAHLAADQRGSFWQVGLTAPVPTQRFGVAFNSARYTLRGLHYQQPGVRKVVVCLSGEVLDVVVDLRAGSDTHANWSAFALGPGNAVVIPPGCAHGYLTLVHGSTLAYLLEGDRVDDCGIRWDDPRFGIAWPARPHVISERDLAWEDYRG